MVALIAPWCCQVETIREHDDSGVILRSGRDPKCELTVWQTGMWGQRNVSTCLVRANPARAGHRAYAGRVFTSAPDKSGEPGLPMQHARHVGWDSCSEIPERRIGILVDVRRSIAHARCVRFCVPVSGSKNPPFSEIMDLGKNGAQERTRTFTTVKPLAPEASASTNSGTWGTGCWRWLVRIAGAHIRHFSGRRANSGSRQLVERFVCDIFL
jgi:hypothetical protein